MVVERFMEEDDFTQIIHNDCGLPVEFCECPDAKVKYNWETGMFESEDFLDEE